MNNYLGYKFKALKSAMSRFSYLYFAADMELTAGCSVKMRSSDAVHWSVVIPVTTTLEAVYDVADVHSFATSISDEIAVNADAGTAGSRYIRPEDIRIPETALRCAITVHKYCYAQSYIHFIVPALEVSAHTAQGLGTRTLITDTTNVDTDLIAARTVVIAAASTDSLAVTATISGCDTMAVTGNITLQADVTADVGILTPCEIVCRTRDGIDVSAAFALYRPITLFDLVGYSLTELGDKKLNELHLSAK